MSKGKSAEHLAWSRMLAPRVRAWMAAKGLRFSDLARELGYESGSTIVGQLSTGISPNLAEKLSKRYPEEFGNVHAELMGILLPGARRPAVGPQIAELIHAAKEGAAATMQAMEALEGEFGIDASEGVHNAGQAGSRGSGGASDDGA